MNFLYAELSSLGLRGYGGPYTFYAQRKSHERENAHRHLAQCKRERRREEQAMREQRERQDRRQARGQRRGRQANQAPILLGRQTERSENSSAALQRQHAVARERLARQVREAAQQTRTEADIHLHPLPVVWPGQGPLAELQAVTLPFVTGPTRRIDLTLRPRQRVGVIGSNGCGKSTLLRLLAGQLAPESGKCRLHVTGAWLDQRLDRLDPHRCVLAHLREVNPGASEADLRMRLAQLDLDAGTIAMPSASLSGGERLKAALACALYADPPARLLLLDEPGNHLDLASLHALETMLRDYRGALVVVSHDDTFLNAIDLTHRLLATSQGWRMEPVGASRR